ncbi:Tudor domain-containing [Brachionus plicatilis]|uniref:Tudor domain-containing n=1 Tax=Brachionus plicatilis TaxID=10195 RepID=A0A3M7RG26_BRAPC|nr:Tudor domain-containing [Brachionus plicatilis]
MHYLARFAAKEKYDFIFLNSICGAFSPRDNLWYRAKITNLDKSLIRLIYIDYGTYDYLSLGNLYPLTSQFAAIPPVTIFSKLNQECGESWTESAHTCFVSSVGKYEFFRATVKCSDNQLSHHSNKAVPLSLLKAYDKNENEISFDLILRKK